jgi:hypothetical protein
MKTIRCAVCGKTLTVRMPTEPADPAGPPVPTVDEAESRLGWGVSSDAQVLCRWHAPNSRSQPLRNVVR